MRYRFIGPIIYAFVLPIAAYAQVSSTARTAQIPRTPTAKALPANVPSLTLRADRLNPSTGQRVRFIALWDRKVSPMTYHFDFGDRQSVDTPQPTAYHTYSTTGTYTVRVSAHAAATHARMHARPIVSNEVSIHVAQSPVVIIPSRIPQIKVSPPAKATVPPSPPPQEARTPPVLTLAANNRNPEPNQSVHFTATWDRSVYRLEYLFEWGDGKTTRSARHAADHAYSRSGSYTARVSARSASSTIARTPLIRSNPVVITVIAPPPPITARLALSADNLDPQTGRTVHFTGRWTAGVSPPSQYVFYWGDGQTSETAELVAEHSYAAPGTYKVHITALPLQGRTAVRSSAITSNELLLKVLQPPGVAPNPPLPQQKATLKADHQHARVGDSILFTASLDPPSAPAQYHFVFGDGNQQDSQSNQVEYSYARGGGFHPWVTIYPVGRDMVVTSPAIQLAIEVPSGNAPLKLILIFSVAGFVVYVVLRIFQAPNQSPEPPRLHVRAFSDLGDHTVKRANPSVPHLSLRLEPGMDSADHEIVFPKRAVA